ncbi:hypothetical protein ABZ805_26580 [Saccharopolyspora sp. NPDC047091]|uniref:hypothetical protein n=1 Tax=Saccharopolyspora sp. NPDC047091 TaxID=3155924 RepID=UPI0033D0BECF
MAEKPAYRPRFNVDEELGRARSNFDDAERTLAEMERNGSRDLPEQVSKVAELRRRLDELEAMKRTR